MEKHGATQVKVKGYCSLGSSYFSFAKEEIMLLFFLGSLRYQGEAESGDLSTCCIKLCSQSAQMVFTAVFRCNQIASQTVLRQLK